MSSVRVLCDEGLRVAVDGGGDRTLLAITDGGAIRFWTETEALERIVRGGSIQLSAHGGDCAIEVTGGTARLEFALEGKGRKRCAFPAAELADALAWVRSLRPHFEGEAMTESP